ncbi:hypothetical protein niasHT_014199 [Heterodera trifolii]|uniref:Chromo domain-containing protein n=1 Tax=Heterodera trifolii TaxID=157864 RepID=A0ABD2KX00_9BILA
MTILHLFLLLSTTFLFSFSTKDQQKFVECLIDTNELPPAEDVAEVQQQPAVVGEANPIRFHLDLNEFPADEEDENERQNDSCSSSTNQTENALSLSNTTEANEPSTSTLTTDSNTPKKGDDEHGESAVNKSHPKRKRTTKRKPRISIGKLNQYFATKIDINDQSPKIPRKARSKRPISNKMAERQNNAKMVIASGGGEASSSSSRTTKEAATSSTVVPLPKEFTEELLQRKRRTADEEERERIEKQKEQEWIEAKKRATQFFSSHVIQKPTNLIINELESPAGPSRSVRRSAEDQQSQNKVPKFATGSPASSRSVTTFGTRNKQKMPSLDVDLTSSSSSDSSSLEEIVVKGRKNKSVKKGKKPIKEKAKIEIIEKSSIPFYEVSKILAMYVCQDRNKTRHFYIDWGKNYPDEESWEPSANIYSQELVANFIEHSTIMSVVHALSGKDSVPVYIAEEVREQLREEKYKNLIEKIDIKTEAHKILFAEDITPRQKQKAKKQIKDFLKSQNFFTEAHFFEGLPNH